MIGVIGGNGVAATNRLCQIIENEITKGGAFRDAHHPEMIIWQATQVPSRSMYLEGRGESFIPGYVEIGKKLKDCGADTLCMCCNTAHFYIDELSEKIGLKFINLIEEVALTAKEQKVKRIGLMCSDGLAKVKFYDDVFKGVYPDAEIVYPDKEYQTMVTKGICNAKNRERFTDENNIDNPKSLFSRVTEHLKEKKVDCVVAGCTDIRNVYYPENNSEYTYIDSLEVLAKAILRTCNQQKII